MDGISHRPGTGGTVSLRWGRLSVGLLAVLVAGCGQNPPATLIGLPIETAVAVTNLSTHAYAAFAVRARTEGQPPGPYIELPLLPPGATHRARWLDLLGDACPPSIDLRVQLYQRINADLPIGLDVGEAVHSVPLAAGEVLDLPACAVQELETYTIVNFDAPPGVARVKIAQGTLLESLIRSTGRFAEPDALWEVTGVEPGAVTASPPPPANAEPLSGSVVLADGTGVPDVAVLLRTRFRVRLTDGNSANDPDAGYSLPIDLVFTDANGAFRFERPPGAYQVEVASDFYFFRPVTIELEAPLNIVRFIAEPLP